MKIEKSQEMRKKEARAAELEEQLKRTRATLKSLKTRLRNTQQRVKEVQQELFNKVSRLQQRLWQGLKNLEQLTEKLRKDKRLKKQDKALIEEMYRGFAGGIGEEMPDLEAQAAEWAEGQEEDAKFRDAFKEFRVEPPKEEQRDIRKLYLRLSKQFHPDRAASKKEAEQYHQFQQQINEAYEKYDIQALLDMEQLFGETPGESLPEDAATTDVLDLRISRLEHQLALLQQQQERLSEEIKQLRKSEMGQMLTEVDGMERAGFSMEQGTGLHHIEQIVEILDAFEAALKDTDKRGKMSPLFDSIMERIMPAINPLAAMMDKMMGMDFDEDFDDGLFWDDEDDEDDEYERNPSPLFPPGVFVRIEEEVELEYFDEEERLVQFDATGLSGQVSAALLDEEDEPFYNITLDIASMKQLPAGYIIEEGQEFNYIRYLEEEWLAEEKGRKKEPRKKVRTEYRKVLYQNIFSGLPPEDARRLQAILLAKPDKSDEDNWLPYLEKNLPFPFAAYTRGQYGGWRFGQKATVSAYGGFAPDYGLIVQARVGRQTDFVPLAEFYGPPGSKQEQVLGDYMMWHGLLF